MSDKFKNSKLYSALKDPKVSRVLYISLVVILVATAIVIGAVAAAKRSRENTPQPLPTPSDTQEPVTDAPNNGGTDSPDTGDSGSAPTVNGVPELSLPLTGLLAKKHDSEVQVFSPTMNDYRVHLGIDIATVEGADVLAAADGTVKKIWKDPMMGYCLAIEHSGDTVTVYKNLAATLPDGIAEGSKVNAGDKIASVGDSSLIEVAEEPHLHFEVTVKDLQTDPLTCFSEESLNSLTRDTAYED